MLPKKPILIRSLLLKNLGLLLLLLPFKMFSQKPVTRIHTDWKGYWTAAGTTDANNRPDDANNLLAFEWNGKTYSTGVNDNMLNSKNVIYTPQSFRALKIQTLGLNNSMYILQGSRIDNDISKAILVPPLAGTSASGAELASRLTDGMNGLSLGTGVANIKIGTAEFKIGTNNLNLTGLKDGIPDLIVTQVAATGGTADVFKFVDKDGTTVGNEISIKFGTVSAVGTYSLDLFKADGGTNGFSPADNRDIRILGIETDDFGIDASNAAAVDRFVVSFSGSSDCAFIAFNNNSLKIAELSLVKKGTLNPCGKAGDTIEYTFEITNTGEVPITNIQLTDPKLGITGSSLGSLAVGATVTVNGSYIITPADVAIGKVVNSAKVTGIDPSFNIVEDLSGETNQDDRPTETILLAPPSIDVITNTSCTSATGSVALTNLPNGAWTIERTPGAVTTNGTGATTTISNLPVGNYTFKVSTPAGCKSPSSAPVNITNQSTTTWNGSTWSHGLPDATKNVIIAGAISITSDLTACSCSINPGIAITVPSGRTLNISNALTVSPTSTLTFENSSSLLQTNTSNNINSGSINYIRNTEPIRQADYVYWSSPVKDQTLVGVSQDLTLGDKYYMYGGTGVSWIGVPKTTKMVVGKGYIIRGPQNWSNTSRQIYTATFKGTPNNGTYTTAENFQAGKSYLLGNPYPSALNADKFILGNNILKGTLYFWTHNTPVVLVGAYKYNADDYASYNLTGGAGAGIKAKTGDPAKPETNSSIPSGKIAAGQSFMAPFKTAGEITYTNDMRIGDDKNGQFFKPGKTSEKELEKHRIWLNMTNTEGAFKQLLVGYIEGASNNFDERYDGLSLNGNKYIDFYSMDDTNNFVIQGRALPFTESDTVPLGYTSTIVGDFTISIDQADGVLSTKPIYLEDKTTGKIHDLTTANYTFATEIGKFENRFVLRYTNKTLGTGDFENIENALLVSVKNKTIKVTSAKENITEVSIYDISGKQLYNKSKIGAPELQLSNLKSGNQILLVKVTLENDSIVTKKIIFQ